MHYESFNYPNIERMKPDEALKALSKFVFESAHVMLQMNREIEALKRQVQQLEARR